MSPYVSSSDASEISDLRVDGTIVSRHILANGFRPYERVQFDAADQERARRPQDILRAGPAAAVLPLDPARGELVLIRQFRLAAHLANGRGHLIEIVAGHVEPHEKPAQTARRECEEEIGLTPSTLIELLTYLTSPGISDEELTLFLGIVDASELREAEGLAAEHEQTRPMRVSIDAALSAASRGMIRNGPLIVALQWLALNRSLLSDIASGRSIR
jgi:ADP-ribose pyrophosphatase